MNKRKVVFILLYVLPLLIFFQGKGPLAADTNIYRDLIDRGIATCEDGCRAIACFVDNVPADTMTFEQLVSGLSDKGVISKKWEYKADKPVTRGIMSYMTCKVLGIGGGLTMRILGTTKRYAYLECQQMGLVPMGHSKIYLSGHDLLALMYRLEQYTKGTKKTKPSDDS